MIQPQKWASAMESHFSVRSELYHFKLSQLYPNAISQVRIEKNLELNETTVCVVFKNGHQVKRLESEIHSKEFLALCSMLYDLPPKSLTNSP